MQKPMRPKFTDGDLAKTVKGHDTGLAGQKQPTPPTNKRNGHRINQRSFRDKFRVPIRTID
jgi:hypothetical protein